MSDLPREILEYVNTRPQGLVLVHVGYGRSMMVASCYKSGQRKVLKLQYFIDQKHLSEGKARGEVAFEEKDLASFKLLFSKGLKYEFRAAFSTASIDLCFADDINQEVATWSFQSDEAPFRLDEAIRIVLSATL
eukprot:scaffold7149_cov196-Amphora_coffeaeformis.AAC.5